MVANPMQRKVRNSFLLGILVMLIITILIGTIVFLLVIKPNLDKKKEEEAQVYAYAFKLKAGVSVESGAEIDSSMVESVEIVVNNEQTDFVLAKTKNPATGVVSDMAFPSGYKSKIDLSGEAVLTYSMLFEEEETPDSLRYVEYNMITMPTTLDYGNYIDIRLRLPNGQDLIVVSKKEIINMYGQTVGLNLTEEEILVLNSAIVESYIMMGAAELYIATYVEPGLQDAAALTYSPAGDVINLIYSDENIVTSAKNYLVEKYNTSSTRGTIDSKKAEYGEEQKYNIEAGMQEQIEAARAARESYLSELQGY